MAIAIVQSAYEVLARAETLWRANLGTKLTAMNAEQSQFTVATPADAQIAARADSKLDEREGGFPQQLNGVWCRITNKEVLRGVGGVASSGGQTRTRWRFEMLSYATVQVQETSSAVPTPLTTGYKELLLLSRCAGMVLTDVPGMVGNDGIYEVASADGGSMIVEPIAGMPNVHQVREYFDVYQKTLR